MNGWAGMIKPEQIPDEVVRLASRAASDLLSDDGIRSTIAAAINAWPGVVFGDGYHVPKQCLVLPLPNGTNNG